MKMTELDSILDQLNQGLTIEEIHLHEGVSGISVRLRDVLKHPNAKVRRIHIYDDQPRMIECMIGICLFNDEFCRRFYWVMHGFETSVVHHLRQFTNWIFIHHVGHSIQVYGHLNDHDIWFEDNFREYILTHGVNDIRFPFRNGNEVYRMLTTILLDKRCRLQSILTQEQTVYDRNIHCHVPTRDQGFLRAVRRSCVRYSQLRIWRYESTTPRLMYDDELSWHSILVLLLWCHQYKHGSIKNLPMADLIWTISRTLGWPMDLLC
jgi:hypothetical protein